MLHNIHQLLWHNYLAQIIMVSKWTRLQWWWYTSTHFLKLHHRWLQRLKSELFSSMLVASLAPLSLWALTLTYDITDNLDFKKFALGPPHYLLLLICSKLCSEIKKLSRWIEDETICCLENKSWGLHMQLQSAIRWLKIIYTFKGMIFLTHWPHFQITWLEYQP